MDKKISIASNYLISFNTIALVPTWVENKLYTRVIENHIEFLVKMKPSAIVKKSITFYGNSYKHAIVFSRESIGQLHKLPLMISHDFGVPLIMMPTLSPESEGTIWISFSAVDRFSVNTHNQCIVHFKNSQVLSVNVSFSTMCRQLATSYFLAHGFQDTRGHLNYPFFNSKPTFSNKKKLKR